MCRKKTHCGRSSFTFQRPQDKPAQGALWNEVFPHSGDTLSRDRCPALRNLFQVLLLRNPWTGFAAPSTICGASGSRFVIPDHRWAAHYLVDIPTFGDFVRRLDEEPAFFGQVRKYFHFRDQVDWITRAGARDRPLVDFIGRYEQLDRDYAILEERLR